MSLHQFAHGGDLHLGPNARNADRRAAFDQFIAEGLALSHLAAWLLPGDINHARMGIDDRNYLADRFTRMANRAPVVGVRGNHDLPGDLDIFEKLATSYPIHFLTTPHVLSIRAATGKKATIFCLPYPTEAGLVVQGVAPGDIVQTAREKLEAIFRHAGAELAVARANGDITLAIGHVNVAGSITAAGQPNIGQEIEIDPTLIALLGGCYVGLNHIHVGQEIGGAWYPGSMCRLDWSEIDPKRWLRVEYLYDVPGRENPVIEVSSARIDVAPMYHVEGDLTREALTLNHGEYPLRRNYTDTEVRARVRVNASERELLTDAKARIEAAIGPCKRLEIELIAVPDRALRAPAVAAARTLRDKVKAWADVTGVVPTESVLKKLATIEFAGEEELTAALERELHGLLAPVAEKALVTA